MQYKIEGPKIINAKIKLPASKSISNRALILKALSMGTAEIKNLSDCDDTEVMVQAFESEDINIDVKAAGTSMRFLTAFLAQIPGEWTITGTKRMQQRPIHILVDALKTLGAHVEYMNEEGFPPLKIRGRALDGGEIYLRGDVSSQFTSALLMIAPTMTHGLTLHLEGEIISIPYLKLTLGMMAAFGAKCHWEGNVIKVHPGRYKSVDYLVESDWSAASYWYEMIALADEGTVELDGLFKDSMQGDSKVADLFVDLGVNTEYTESGVRLTKTNRRTKKFFHNFINEPDLAQTFVATCCALNIPFLYTGLQTLKIKETDRIEALKIELKKLGFILKDSEDSILEWDGERSQVEEIAAFDTYEDHRMAMALAPLTIKKGALKMNEPHVITKSYPRYWDDLKEIGFTIEKQ